MIGHTYCRYSYKEQMKAVEIVNDMIQTFICEDENDPMYRLASISIDKNYRFTHAVEWADGRRVVSESKKTSSHYAQGIT